MEIMVSNIHIKCDDDNNNTLVATVSLEKKMPDCDRQEEMKFNKF